MQAHEARRGHEQRHVCHDVRSSFGPSAASLAASPAGLHARSDTARFEEYSNQNRRTTGEGRWVRDLPARATSPRLFLRRRSPMVRRRKRTGRPRRARAAARRRRAPGARGGSWTVFASGAAARSRARSRSSGAKNAALPLMAACLLDRRDADPRQHPAPHRYHDARAPAGPARGRDRHGRPREARRQRRAGALAPGPPDRQHEGPLRAGETDARLHPGAGPAARPHGAGDRLAPRRLRHRHAAGGPAHRRAHPPRRPGRARRRRHPRARAAGACAGPRSGCPSPRWGRPRI